MLRASTTDSCQCLFDNSNFLMGFPQRLTILRGGAVWNPSRVQEAKREANDFGGGRPHTLLPQIYGLYTVKMEPLHSDIGKNGKLLAGGIKKHWIVMANILATKLRLEYRFDLKGSTHKRTASEGERKKGAGWLLLLYIYIPPHDNLPVFVNLRLIMQRQS